MRACNCGESLTRSVQENAAKRTVATTTRAQFCERAELFIALRASDSGRRCASNFLCGFPLPCRAKGREDAPHSKALRAKCPKAIDYFAKPFRARTSLGVAYIVNRQRWSQVPLAFGTQHHDWLGTLSPLRVRGPFRPILCSRSMGPHLTGPGSSGDVRNDASTQGSSRAQTAVLSP
jgi:hypothetical protein